MRAKRAKINAEIARQWCIEAMRLTDTKGGYFAADIKVPGANVFNIAAQKLKWAEKPDGNRRFKWTYEVDITILTGERLVRGYHKYYKDHPAKNGTEQPIEKKGIKSQVADLSKSNVYLTKQIEKLTTIVNRLSEEIG